MAVMTTFRGLLVATTTVGLLSCAPAGTEPSIPSITGTRASSPAPISASEEKKDWRKPRFISVVEAIRRLQPHVDVPVVAPRVRLVGAAGLKAWMADPKYLDWNVVDGRRIGGMTLRKKNRILILSYGLSGFDGCGDRTMAIETNVLGEPALINISEGHEWTTVLWPVTDTGSTGRYGISGTFYPEAMMRLAESMELARLEAVDHQKAC
jgi:hypothetical protein